MRLRPWSGLLVKIMMTRSIRSGLLLQRRLFEGYELGKKAAGATDIDRINTKLPVRTSCLHLCLCAYLHPQQSNPEFCPMMI